MTDTLRVRLLLAAAALSITLAVLMSVMFAESGTAPFSPEVEIGARGIIASILAALLLMRRRWAGAPLALFDLTMARWFAASFRAPMLSSQGRNVMLVALVLEIGCVVVLLSLRPPARIATQTA